MKTIELLTGIFIFTVVLTGSSMAQEIQKGDFLTQAIDSTVSPGIDFFKYATGTWMKNNPIPSTEKAWGIGNLVQEETYSRLKQFLKNRKKQNPQPLVTSKRSVIFILPGWTHQALKSRVFHH